MENPPLPNPKPVESEEQGRKRFAAELEFVQSLADPEYIHYLAVHKEAYLSDGAFVAWVGVWMVVVMVM